MPPMSDGVLISITGALVLFVSLVLLLVYDPIAVVGLILGGLLVIGGLLRTYSRWGE